MTPLSKSHEGCIVEVKPLNSKSSIQRRKIVKVWEDGDCFEFKYYWPHHIAMGISKNEFSDTNYRDTTSDWAVVETLTRYDKPLNILTEIKFAIIRTIHLIMERMEFNLSSSQAPNGLRQ